MSSQNKNKKVFIFSAISLGILFIFLFVVLIASMYAPGVYWSNLDRETVIDVALGLLQGYLGLLGAVIGIVGAYLVLKKQLSNENDKSNEKQILDLKMMKCLLEYTLCETDHVINKICEEYISLYSRYLGSELLEFKVENKNMELTRLISDLAGYDPKGRDIEFFKELYKEPLSPTGYDDDFAYVDWIRITNLDYTNTYSKIYKLVSEVKDENLLVYDKDWNRYLVAIKDSNKFDFNDIQNIIKWLCLFKDNSKKDEKYINNQEYKKNFNINKLEPIKDITNFINIRDEIIKLVEDENRFREDSVNWEFENSREHLNNNINYSIEGIEIVTRISNKLSM